MRYALVIVNWCLTVVTLQAQVCQTQGNMIKSVSTEFNGSVYGTLISWSVPEHPNAIGYVIYEYLGGNDCTREITRITDLSATTYLANAIAPKGYTMAVLTPQRPEPITQQHKQPVITEVDFNPCDYTATIHWTPYAGWDTNHTEYAVYARAGTATTYTLLAAQVRDTSYMWANAPTREPLSILVQAVNTSDASATGKAQPWEGSFDFPRLPAYLRLSAVDYAGGKAALTFAIDPTTELTKFEVHRAAADGNFETIAALDDKNTTAYIDQPDEGISYCYRLVAKNDCDAIALVGDTLSLILVEVNQDNNTWQLQWNNVTPPAMEYTLSRLQPQPVVLLSDSPLTTYIDNMPVLLNEPSLTFCYSVAGITAMGAKSRSQVCMDYMPTVIMPDAVDPLGANVNPQTGRSRSQFGPVINVNPQTYSYRLVILNRNGAVVADINKTTTDNPLDKSWDGRLRNGDPAPDDVFTYHLSVEFDSGYRQTITGIVTVMYSK